MGATDRPNIHKGDYVGFTSDTVWSGSKKPVDVNAWVVSEPYKVGSEWKVTINFDKDRLDSFWASSRALKDANVAAENVYVIERSAKGKIKEFIKMKLGKPAIVTAIVLGVLVVTGLWLAGNYNSLVSARNAVDNSRAKIDTQLTRRYELIDNIVQSVQGSQAQESDVFGKIAEARKLGGNSNSSTEQQATANQAIDTQIALLPRLQEAYPDLKSNVQVSSLISELQGTANGLRDARDNYNNTVTNYNTNITSFPKSVFAGLFNFDKAKLFEASANEKVNPKVELDRENN